MRQARVGWLVAIGVSVVLGGEAAEANCQLEGPYEIRQCGRSTWFAPPPPGAGSVSAQWWQIGMGNATLFHPITSTAADGSGFVAVPLPGLFIGNDSGYMDAYSMDLAPADAIPGLGAPAGSLCFSSRANWGSPGVDGCADMNRTATGGGGATNASNNYLNTYWSRSYGPFPGYGPFDEEQVDAPMGVLLKESSGLHFALAFFANESRGRDPLDIQPGQYSMGAIVNGLPGPSGDNVVPWQRIPFPRVTFSCESATCETQTLALSWSTVSIHSDDSTRPCFQLDGVTPCASFAPGVTGVGVNDQGPLVHYQVETAPLSVGSSCSTTWTPVPGAAVEHPANFVTIPGVSAPFCVRLTTRFGRTPANILCLDPVTSCRDLNRLAAQTGRLGDIGYQVTSAPQFYGGPLAAESIRLTSATRGRGGVTVEWESTSELNVTSYDVVALTAKGRRQIVAASVACRECTTGAAASYSVVVPQWKLRGAKSLRVVMRPSGVESQTMLVR